MTVLVYQAYDADGVLLYVGHTSKALADRIRLHRAEPLNRWIGLAARWEITKFATLEGARAAEGLAVCRGNPWGNGNIPAHDDHPGCRVPVNSRKIRAAQQYAGSTPGVFTTWPQPS